MEELLRACEKRSYKSFKDLTIGEYTVKNFSAVETKYGMRLRVDCEGFYVFLPERLSKPTIIDPANIEKMNKREQIMIFRGKDAELLGRLDIDFRPVDFEGAGYMVEQELNEL